MAILEVKNVVKDYGSLRAVDQVSFDIKEGEIFGLLGPNGAGKTTLISTIMTLEKLTQGEIFVAGYDIQKNPRMAKSIIGFMPQELIVHGYFTVQEVIRFYSGFCGVVPSSERIEYLLKKLSLWEQRNFKVRALSGGMMRRLLMIKALVHYPKLLLLDEPTAGVDIHLRNAIWKYIRELNKEGISILFTTHYLEEAEQLCDRVAFIDKGKISHMGETKKLISDLTTRKVYLRLKKQTSISHQYYVGQEDDYHIFLIPYSLDVGPFIHSLSINIVDIIDIKIKEGNLEDVFKKVLSYGN